MNVRLILLFITLLGCFGSPASAAEAASKLPEHFDLKAIDDYLTERVKPPHFVGLSVAIVQDGRVVLAKGYGERSLEDGRPVLEDTLFAIGSVTKQFTCACILLLAEEGKLSVRDPVSKYYPSLTRAHDITLLDLMNHVSGYPDYYPLDFVERRMQKTIEPDQLLRQYAGAKLDFEPGTKWSYSNTGYILLGRVVERLSGQAFGAFLAERILKPLAMNHTAYEPAPTDERLAQGYSTFALSEPEAIGPEGTGWIGAAGGIYSTPTDLAIWDLALSAGTVLKPESLALMTAPRELANGRFTSYGCGLSVRMQEGRRLLSHSGAVSGFNASNWIIPSTRSAVVMMCNKEGGLASLPGEIGALLLKDPQNVPVVQGPPAAEMAKTLFAQLQEGKVDREILSEEFNFFLTDEKISSASKRLSRFGQPEKAAVNTLRERGGMEVSVTRLTFQEATLRTLMYRMPNGKVEQFFVDED